MCNTIHSKHSNIIKIFLASSIKELKEERRDLSGEISGDISSLFENNNTYIHFVKSENNHAGNDGSREQNYYDHLLEGCEYSIFLFKTHLGDRTEEEYDIAKKLQKTHNHVIFMYFLQAPKEEKEQRLIDFQANLDIDWEECNNVEDVEKKFILGFLKRQGVKVDTTKSDKIGQEGETLFNRYLAIEEEQIDTRNHLHKIIDDLPATITSIMSSSSSIVATIAQVRDLYSKADYWASYTNYDKNMYFDLLSNYCDFVYQYGLYGGAINVFFKYIGLAEELYGEKSLRAANAYNRIGALYDCLKEYDQALKFHRLSLRTRIKVLGRRDPATADSYTQIGIVLSEKNRNMMAILCFYKALRIRGKVFGEDNPSLARDYINIGWLFCIQDMYKSALHHMQKAKNIVDKDDDSVKSYLYNNLAFVCMCINKEQEALDYFNEAITIREKNLGAEHPDTAESYINIGYLYEKMKDNEKSMEYYKKALALPSEFIKPIHHRIRRSYLWNKLTYKQNQDGVFTYLKKSWR